MNKKKAIFWGIIVILGVGLASWVFFSVKKKGKMEISQDNLESAEQIQQDLITAEEGQIKENTGNNEIIAKSPEDVVEEFKQEQKKPTEIVIKPEEIIKEPEQQKDLESSLKIVEKLVSFGFQKHTGTRKIDTVVLHSSFNSLGGDQYDVDKIVDIYKSYGVSAHYIVGRDGTAYRLVRDNDISYHAGVSQVPDGRTNANAFSIGIEIVANYEDGYSDEQYSAVNALIKDIKSRYEIKYVLGHDDIAPGRKTDPWNFEWNKLGQ